MEFLIKRLIQLMDGIENGPYISDGWINTSNGWIRKYSCKFQATSEKPKGQL
jgi:hypothetical protein